MKKLLCLSALILSAALLRAQNVGIGNPTPNEKLDVTGNINLTGTIKANGVDGTANQVLMKNSSGTFTWGSLGDFKNIATFTDTSNLSIPWAVPTGITRIAVELWGGGGAGLHSGGGGGAYLYTVLNVTPGQNLLITVGKGGRNITQVSGSLTYNEGGSGSRIDIVTTYFIANGGSGGSTSTAFSFPQYSGGVGGTYITNVSPSTSPRGSFYAESGQTGGGYKQEYETIGSNQYFLHKLYGIGGAAAHAAAYPGEPSVESFSVIVSPSSTTQILHSSSKPGVFPGGGGGGSAGFVNDNRAGANGLVLIHY